MSTPNDATILRFYKDDVPAPSLSIVALDALARRLIDVAISIAEIPGINLRGTGALHLVAPPRRGCLEILVIPELHLDGLEGALNSAAAIGGALLHGLRDNREVIDTVWKAAFGGLGVFQIWNMRKDSSPAKASGRGREPGVAVEIIIAQEAFGSPGVLNGLRSIVETVGTMGMDRISIQVPDGPEIDLYSGTMRRLRGLIASQSDKTPMPPTDDIYKLIWHGSPKIAVEYQGGDYQGFSAGLNGQNVFIIWGSKREPLVDTVLEVRGSFINADLVEPLGDVSAEAEAAAAAFLVKGVIAMD